MLLLGACGASPTAEPVAPAAPAETVASATTGPGTSPPVTTVMHGDTAPPPAPESIAPVRPGAPSQISCTAYYRPFGDESVEGAVERPVVLDVVGAGPPSGEAVFDTMSFGVRYLGPETDDTPSITLSVTARDGAPLASVLYQLGVVDLTSIQFVGGHGFTGLHDVDHDGAQLQFWCGAI